MCAAEVVTLVTLATITAPLSHVEFEVRPRGRDAAREPWRGGDHTKSNGDNITIARPERGTDSAYTLDHSRNPANPLPPKIDGLTITLGYDARMTRGEYSGLPS